MQNIHVRRYQDSHAFQGSVEPEDRSWLIFIDKDGHATFWRRTQLACPIGIVPNMGEVISNEVWYDVESTTLPDPEELALAEASQQSASP